jgi:putative ABC transport system substrate-binding protein
MRRAITRLIAGVVVLLVALAAEAQPPDRTYRLGTLNLGTPPTAATYDARRDVVALLGELGYVEGKNLHVERRNANGRAERLPALAAELVQSNVDVIVAGGGTAVRAARNATKTIPIVALIAGPDPVELGLAASLARPGGNVTGIVLGALLASKRLELLKEAVPGARTIAMLFASGESSSEAQVREARQTAALLGVRLITVEVEGRNFEKAFETMRRERAEALFVGASPRLHAERTQIIALAAQHRLPAIYQFPEHAEEGGLMAYGMSGRWASRRVALYVDRVLKGAKPAELPIEQTTTLTLALNLKTAKALGLTIPQSVLLRAEQVIE